MKKEEKSKVTDIEVNKASFASPQFTLISKDQIEEVHLASLDVLENVGNLCYSDKALEYFKNAGCSVNGKLVKVPAWLAQEAINYAPKRVTIYNRKGERAMELERRRSFYGNAPTAPFTRDIYSGEKRNTTLEDIALHSRIIDNLPNIDFICPPGTPQDVPGPIVQEYMLKETILNSKKPIVQMCNDELGVQAAFEIAVAVAGSEETLYDKPFLIIYPEPTSPLMISEEAANRIIKASELRLPLIYLSAPMLGATSPVTPAGTAVQGNAECLFGLVLSHLVRKGNPFGFGVYAHGFNMTYGNAMMCDPSAYITYNIHAQVAQYYGIYTWGLAGACDSKTVDGQAGIECALTLFLNALCGLNLIHDSGFLESCMVESAEIFVICNEMISWVKQFMKGVDFSREALGRELIEKVGPKGTYLAEDHTAKHFREIFWDTKLFDRGPRHVWENNGSKTFEQRVKEKTIELAEHSTVEPLDEAVVKKVSDIVEKYRKIRKV